VSVTIAVQQKSVRDYQHVYLVNVGVNLAHKLRSPIFPDARFEFVPIPEGGDIGECVKADITPITYADLFCYNSSRKLLFLFSHKLQAVRPHFKLNQREDWQRFHVLLEYITAFNDMPAFVPWQLCREPARFAGDD
jgi:hypothetical protein